MTASSAIYWYPHAPITATGLGGYYDVVVCPACGRGTRKQVRDLRIELLPGQRAVWLTDGGAILAATTVVDTFAQRGASMRPVVPSWRYQISAPVPQLVQIVPSALVHAARVRLCPCACGAVEEIPFRPLLLRSQESWPELALLAENGCTVLCVASLRAKIAGLCPELEWEPAYLEGSYDSPKRSFDRSDWSDLLP